MNFRKLITYLTMGTAAAMPLAVAQNPTILQGSYISNVFGNSNFIKNPNAQTNIADVTVSNATVTRSTATPLVATSEFLVTTSTATGSATWSTRTFDSGMKGQNCEARFSYRGFSVGSTTAQILQGANVVAQLTLTASTDPRIASINFPCGDLSSATTFRLQQATASLTGTNEIGGIYIGLATNMANVAQAELVGTWTMTGATNCIFSLTVTSFDEFNADSDCNDPVVTGNVGKAQGKRPWINIINPKPGNYYVVASATFETPTNVSQYIRLTGSGSTAGTRHKLYSQGGITNYPTSLTLNTEYTSGSLEFQLGGYTTNAANAVNLVNANADTNLKFTVYRFPSSSELVVTPERQNVFASVKAIGAAGSGNTNAVNSAAWTKLTSTGALTRTNFGKAKVESNNDFSITIENMPVGNYYISATGVLYTIANGSGLATSCFFALADTATGGAQIASMQVESTGDATLPGQTNFGSTFGGVYNNTSVGTRTFFIQAYRGGGTGTCNGFSDGGRPLTITVIPLDQPSNSALYVQGPVLGAQTGAAIPAGYQGETKTSSCTARVSGSTTLNTYTDLTGNGVGGLAAITLDPGVWLLTANLPQGYINWSSGASSAGWGDLAIRESSNIIELQAFAFAGDFGSNWYTSSTDVGGAGIHTIVNITSQKTYKLSIAPRAFSGTPVFGTFQAFCDVSPAKITAIRLN